MFDFLMRFLRILFCFRSIFVLNSISIKLKKHNDPLFGDFRKFIENILLLASKRNKSLKYCQLDKL